MHRLPWERTCSFVNFFFGVPFFFYLKKRSAKIFIGTPVFFCLFLLSLPLPFPLTCHGWQYPFAALVLLHGGLNSAFFFSCINLYGLAPRYNPFFINCQDINEVL